MPNSAIENDFSRAEADAQAMLDLRDAIAVLPSASRRQLVFQALALAEREGRSGRRANGRAVRRGRASGAGADSPYEKLVIILRKNRGMPIADLAKAVYGNNSTKHQQRIRSALNSMKGTKVRPIKNAWGKWEAI